VTDVSRLPIGPIFKVKLHLWRWAQQVVPKRLTETPLRRWTTQNTEFSSTAKEGCDLATSELVKILFGHIYLKLDNARQWRDKKYTKYGIRVRWEGQGYIFVADVTKVGEVFARCRTTWRPSKSFIGFRFAAPLQKIYCSERCRSCLRHGPVSIPSGVLSAFSSSGFHSASNRNHYEGISLGEVLPVCTADNPAILVVKVKVFRYKPEVALGVPEG
jgi:hypothetical protein